MSFLNEAEAIRCATHWSEKDRIKVEHCLVISLVDELLEHGFKLTVDHGVEMHPVKDSIDRERILAALGETEEDQLVVRRPGGRLIGSVTLGYGRGRDVIRGWSSSLDPYIPNTMEHLSNFAL